MNEKMLGIIDPDGYEKVNRVYDTEYVSPTVTARDYKDPIKVLVREKTNGKGMCFKSQR